MKNIKYHDVILIKRILYDFKETLDLIFSNYSTPTLNRYRSIFFGLLYFLFIYISIFLIKLFVNF